MALGGKAKWPLVFVGSLVLLFALLHTPSAKELIRRMVVRVASSFLGGGVSVGAIDYQLWRGAVELDDVALEPDLTVLPFAFSADRLEVELTLPLKISARIERPELVFIDFFDAPTSDYTPVLTYIEKLQVVDGAIRFQDRGENGELQEWIATEGVNLDIFDTGDEHRAAVHARGGHVYDVTFGAIDADLLLSPAHLRAVSASVFKDDSFVRATGELDFASKLEGDLELEFALDGALARLIDDQLDVIGVVTGRTRVDFADGSSTVDATLESESLAWKSVSAEDIEAEARYESGKLTLRRLEARGYDGRARLSAEIAFDADARNRFELSWAGIDAGAALNSGAGVSLPFASRISGDATLALTGFDFKSASGGARVELDRGSEILGTLEASLGSELVAIQTRDVSFPELGATLGVDGTVTTSGHMELDVDVTLSDVAATIENPPVPVAGALSARGHVRGPIDAPEWRATLASDGLRIRGEPATLTGDVTGSAQSVSLNGVQLAGEVVSVTTEGSVPLSDSREWNLNASVNGMVEGAVAVFGAAHDPDWSADLELRPGDGSYALIAHKSGRRIHVDELTGSLATASLEGQGSYDLDSESAEATLSVSNFRASELEATAEYLHGFDGVVSVDADISGPWLSPDARAEVRVEELTYGGAELPSLNLSLVTADETLRLQVSRDDGASLMTGDVKLSESYPLHAEIALDALPISAILSTIPVFLDRERAVWTASGTAVIDVPLKEPSALVFRADVGSLEARLPNASARASRFTLAGDLDRVRVDGFELRGDEDRVRVDGFIPLSTDARFELDAEADFDLSFLRTLEPDLEVSGNAVIQGSVRGTLAQPDVEGNMNIDDSAGTWNALAWSELTLAVTATEDRLSAIALDANVLDGRIEVNGAIPLVESAAAGRLELHVVDVDLMPEDRDGWVILGITGAVDVPGPDPKTWFGSGSLERLSIRGEETGMDLVAPAPWRFAEGALSIPDVRVEGDRSRLALDLDSLELTGDLAFDATADGEIDMALLNALFDSGGTRIEGLLELEAAARRVDGELDVSGRASLTGARLAMVDPGFVLSDASATIILDGAMVTVSELSARAGSGSLTGDGTVDLSVLSRPVFDLHGRADGVPLEIMDGLRAEVSGGLSLVSVPGEPDEPDEPDEPGELRLSGNLAIDRGLLTRELDDDDNNFSSQTVVLSDPTAEPGPLDELVLNVVIATARNIRVENSVAQLEVAGSLSVGGTIAAPDFGGFITVQRDGTFNIGRNKFQVIQGRLDLTGFPLTSPNIDLTAVTKVGSTAINVDLEGDINDMRTTLTAPESPELTEGDLASLLMTGRTLENAGEGGQQMATTWMMSSLANLAHDGLGDLISFGPAPGAGPLILAEEADPTARLTLGYPVTERLSVTYSIALDSTERRLWILDYRVARNVWLRGIQENSNDYSLGLSQRFSLDLRERPVAARAAAREQSIARVQIDGAPPDIAERVKIRAGDSYDYWIARDEAVKMEEALIKSGYRSAVVDVDAEVNESAESKSQDAVSLRFVVHTGKATEFVWRGDDPGKDVKKMVERMWAGRIPEDFLLANVEREATAELHRDRYYTARIEASIEELEDQRAIVFDVTRGPRGKTLRLTFDGNASVSDEALREALPDTNTRQLFLLLGQRAELERGIRLRYAADGYLDARIGAVRTSYDTVSESFDIEIPVDEGTRSEIVSVSFDGELTFDSEKLSSELGVQAGTPVDFPEIRRGQTRLRTLYRNEGFPDVKVRAGLERTEEGLNIVVDIDEGGRARVGDFRIVGNLRTHPSVIRNELTFESNDPVRIIDFQETQKRLYDLGIFRSADVRPEPTQQGQEIQDIVIQVVERSDVDVSYGLRYNVVTSEQSVSTETEPKSTGLEVVSRINFVNQVGRGTNLGLSIFFQSKYQLFRTTFRVPTFLGRRIVTEWFLDAERDEEQFGVENFETRSDGITFQQTKKLTDNRHEKFALQWNFRFARIRSRRFNENNVLRAIDTNRPRFGISLIEDRRDSFANPTRGRFWNITVQAVPEIWGSDVGYVRLYGQFFYYYPLAKWLVWASGFRMGFAQGSSELLLMDDRFLTGGANSVRGFKQNTLGPSVFIEETQERVFIGGQAVGVYNQELRFPIYKAFHGGVYWDAGNVFALSKQFRLADLRHSIGAGIRFVLPFGAIRFDFAKALNARPTDETTWFHFSFGYAF